MTTKAEVFDDSFDCIIGLAYPSMAAKFSTGKHVPLFDSIIKNKLLENNVFAFYLGKDPSVSTLTFGWADKSKFSGPLNWHPVRNQVFWSLKLTKVTVEVAPKKFIHLCEKHKDCLATVDSGTSSITFPSWAYNRTK